MIKRFRGTTEIDCKGSFGRNVWIHGKALDKIRHAAVRMVRREIVRHRESRSKWQALCQLDSKRVVDVSRALEAARLAHQLGDMRLSSRWAIRAEQLAAGLGGARVAEIELERASLARHAGRILACRHHVARAIRADPNSAVLRERAADLLQRLGDLERAAACLSNPTEMESNGVPVPALLLRRAMIAAERGKTGEALLCAERVAKAQHVSAAILVSAGHVFLSVSDSSAAENCFGRALGRDPRNAEAHMAMAFSNLHRGRIHTAHAHALRAADLAPNHPRTRFVGAVVRLLGNVPARQTLMDFDAAVNAFPKDSEIRVLRARARRAAGDARGALEDLMVAKHSGSEAQNFMVDLEIIALGRQFWGFASIEELTGMAKSVTKPAYSPVVHRIWAQGEKLLAKTLWALPKSALPLLAQTMNDQHHQEEGELATPRSLRLRLLALLCPDELLRVTYGNRSAHPTYVDPRTGQLVSLQLRRSSRHLSKSTQWALLYMTPDEVLQSFAAMTREYPRSHHPDAYRGEVLLWLGRHAEAAIDFTRGLEKNPNARWLHIGMGAVHLFQGNLQLAMASFQRSIDIAPDFVGPTLHAYRGEALRLGGRPRDALRDLQLACRDTPSRVSAWVNLWLARDDLGEETARDTAMDELAARAPFLLSDAAEECFSRSIFEVETPADQRRLLKYVLVMMRGNRSSTCVTYFTKTNELRIVTR